MFKYQTIIILLLVLGAATCFIAYLSDQLGMKLGKKRISLKVGRFSLRPRQTATALSMASSLAVMIVTMLVLLAINPSLRKGLLYYDEARRENTRLGLRNAQLKTQSEQQQTAIDRQTQATRKLENSLRDKNLRLAGLNNRVAEKQSQVNVAQQKLDAAQRNLQSAQSERESAQKARDAAQSARDAAQVAQNRAQSGQQQARAGEAQARQSEAQARTSFQAAQARYQAAQARLQTLKQQEEKARAGADKAREDLSLKRAELSSAQSDLERARTTLGEAGRQAMSLRINNLGLTRQKIALDVLIAQQQKNLAILSANLEAAGFNLRIAKGILSGEIKVAVPAGQVFSATTIPTGTSAEQALTILHRLLDEAAQNAKSMNFQAISLDMSSVQQDTPETDLSDEQKLEAAAKIFADQAPVSVRIIAARDHPEGESQLSVRPLGVLVRPVFRSGEVIAKTVIKSGQNDAEGDAQVFNQLLSLLDEGQKTATDRHISAIPTAEEPNFYASDTRLSIFRALRQIQQKGGEVPVRLVAATAISTIEPVRIRIEVGDDSASPSAATPDENSSAA